MLKKEAKEITGGLSAPGKMPEGSYNLPAAACQSGQILAKIEGLQAGCVEALMLNHRDEVAECTGDNIFLVRASMALNIFYNTKLESQCHRIVYGKLASQS